ncbi:hypothetical protein A8C75_02170 [Marinobacterium aestuarii]|uniref:TIGR02001 family outer membrane protein n=1 Tax=Marinobacterium aestuarii TaxID=1821621 RepID=A0A1A9EUQ3_9GAMM|nr:TorF family putative porin [Marinobacterium aestuarii]ANG61388.1 hypothetical protein A8C75_02170 [Marinobacterium aestuarii]
MKNLLAKTLLGLALITPAALVQAEISGNVSLTSDYRFRGISQSGEDPALQGGLDYSHASGFFAGVWGSNVDFYAAGDAYDNDESVELDIYAGYYGEIRDGISYDLSLYRYFYPGAITSADYNELSLGMDLGPARLAYWYAEDYFNSGEDYSYIEANYSLALPAELALGIHAGHSFGSYFDDPAAVGLDEYNDYSLTLSGNWAGLDIALAYMNTDIDAAWRINSGHLANQDAWVLSISKSL